MQPTTSMPVSHGANCVQGCLISPVGCPGSIVRFSSPAVHSPGLMTRLDQLAVILRPPGESSGTGGAEELYHCAPITRTPSVALGSAHRVRYVQKHEVAYVESHGPVDLLIVQELPKDTFMSSAQFNFHCNDCVQPADVRRIPQKNLHQLPGSISLRMVESSLEAVLRRVDGIACAIGDPIKSRILPDGLNDHRRREDIITFNLLRTVDRMKQLLIVAQPASGVNPKRSRKTSIWEQGTVPRNGGRG